MPSSSSSGYPLVNQCSPPAVAPAGVATGSGWVSWPPIKGTDLQAHCFLIQLWQAVRERQYILGRKRFPRMTESNIGRGQQPSSSSTAPIDAGGIVSGVTYDSSTSQYTVTDNQAWWVGTFGCTYTRLNAYTCTPPDPTIPSNYDAIFETKGVEDWTGVFRATIVGQSSETSFQIGRELEDLVTGGYLSSVNAIVGSTIHFIKTGGLWWADVANVDKGRWPHFPNEWELERGTGAGNIGGTFTDSAVDPEKKWTPNQFAGKELLVYATDGRLRRLPIYCNDHNKLYLTASPCMSSSSSSSSGTSSSSSSGIALSGNFIIVEVGAKGMPQRYPWAPFSWYGGAFEPNRYTHHPNDSLAAYGTFPAAQVPWDDLICDPAGNCNCEEVQHPGGVGAPPTGALDLDMWSDYDNECTPDKPFAPLLYKTIRAIQNEVVGLATYFVEAKDWDSFEGTTIPNLTVARMFQLDGTNSWQTTITSVDGVCGLVSSSSGAAGYYVAGTATLGAGFSPAPEVYPPVYFAIYDAKGNLKVSGKGSVGVSGGGSSSSSGGSSVQLSGDGITTEHCGMTVILSLGYSRFIPREFKYMFGKCCFIPDVCAGSFGPFAQYPAAPCKYCCPTLENPNPTPAECCKDCNGVGRWVNRPNPSLAYSEPDAFGVVLPGVPFVAGEYARYIGDNWHDTFDGREVPTGDNTSPTAGWYDHFYRGGHGPSTEVQITAQRSGVATDGGAGFIADATKSWWNQISWSAGANHVDTGTATGGSATTLIDTTKNPDSLDGTVGVGCFWNPERFVGWTANTVYTDFILEVQFVTGGPWIKRPIVSSNASTQTLTVSPAFPASTSGKAYRIREPAGELNRWKGRRLRIYPALCSTNSSSSTSSGSSSSSSSGVSSSSSSSAAEAYYEVIITHSDDTTLWWDTTVSGQSVPAMACYRYEIVEPDFGGVWQFSTTPPASSSSSSSSSGGSGGSSNGGGEPTYWKIADNKYWIKPTGADAVRLGVPDDPQVFHRKQEENLPTVVRRYGPVMKGDYVSMEALTQIYRAINRLRWTKHSATWWNCKIKTGGGGWEGGLDCDICGVPSGADAYTGPNIFNKLTQTSDTVTMECYGAGCIGGGTLGPCTKTYNTSTYVWRNATEGTCSDGSRPYAHSDSGYTASAPCDNSTDGGLNSAGETKSSRWAKGRTTKPTIISAAVDFYNFGSFTTTDGTASYRSTTHLTAQDCQSTCPSYDPGNPYLPYYSELVQEFKSGGNLVAFKQWMKWHTVEPNTNATVETTAAIGSDATPPEHATPTVYEPGDSTCNAGWDVINECAIARWDVTNGLTFVD